MPFYIGTTEYDVYVGNKQVDVYQGTTPITGESVDPLDCSSVAGQPTGETVCSGTTLIGYRYTGQPSADGLSCATETYIVESNSTSCGFTNPTNTYTPWVNSGSQYTDVDVSDSGFGSWVLIGAPSTQEYQNEQQCRTITTTTRVLQDITRSCTASGGCTGLLEDTEVISVTVDRVQDCNTRSTEGLSAGVDGSNGQTRNPFYTPPFTADDISANASIDPNTGSIHSITVTQPSATMECAQTFEYGQWTVGLAAGQASSFIVLQTGADSVERDIKLNVRGLVPKGFAEECEEFDIDVTIQVDQTAPSEVFPVITAEVNYISVAGTRSSRTATDGGIIGIEIEQNSEYEVAAEATGGADFDSTKFGIGSSYSATGPDGRKHNLSATNRLGTATMSFTVIATSGGLN